MFKRLSILSLSLILTACFSTAPKTPPVTATTKQPKIALALGGGAAKGFAHIGVIKVLEQEGIKVDIVSGTSAGAIVGSLYASGLHSSQIESEAIGLDEFKLADFQLSLSGFIKGDRIQEYVNKKVGNRPIQNLPKTFAAVATNLDTGDMTVFRSGNTGQAVRASASIPNIFQPVVIGNKRYVDGGLSAPVPVSAAKQMGADIIIAVDISAKPVKGVDTGFLSFLDQSLNIMSASALRQELSGADIVIRPDVSKIGAIGGFSQREAAIKSGEIAAKAALPKIKALIAQKKTATLVSK